MLLVLLPFIILCVAGCDRCAMQGRYGDGICDENCPKPDPDCNDECEQNGLYGDGYCDDWCPKPDPDCGISWTTTTSNTTNTTSIPIVTTIPGPTTTSIETTTTTIDSGVDTEKPTIPSNLVATAISRTEINLSWNASTDNVGVTYYKLYRGGVSQSTVLVPPLRDTGLTASTQYCYQVSAVDAAGNESEKSNQSCATTIGYKFDKCLESGVCVGPDIFLRRGANGC
jgi:hypothetical protein